MFNIIKIDIGTGKILKKIKRGNPEYDQYQDQLKVALENKELAIQETSQEYEGFVSYRNKKISDLNNRIANESNQAVISELQGKVDAIQSEITAATTLKEADILAINQAYQTAIDTALNDYNSVKFTPAADQVVLSDADFALITPENIQNAYYQNGAVTFIEPPFNLSEYRTNKLMELEKLSYQRSRQLIVDTFELYSEYDIQRKIDNILGGVSTSLTAASYQATVAAFIQAYRDVETAVIAATNQAGVDLAISAWNPPVNFV